ncbi:hypothetical protein PUV54_00205 [Hyphococcus flavus]|uniref:HTH cro/C1-type domain-containing protein n=1 Tax=Hyphococcus flavus TaxID=1866326 RepID=A0AAF0CBR0_9PROT|nr:hypothetical protein [Hyphococcus flavus]WDI31615.1 hypothetical protein PUV54_00205 [Hyphococcus flavus]
MRSDVGWIRRGLAQPGKTQMGLADALGRNRSVVTRILKGDRPLKDYEVSAIEEYLGMRRNGSPIGQQLNMDKPAPLAAAPSDIGFIYVMQSAPGGRWCIDLESPPAERAPKPASHASVRGLYGVIVSDPAMAPRFKPGEIAWINPHRPPRPGDDVMFVETDAPDFGPAEIAFGELIETTISLYKARTYTPLEIFTLKRAAFRPLMILPRD